MTVLEYLVLVLMLAAAFRFGRYVEKRDAEEKRRREEARQNACADRMATRVMAALALNDERKPWLN
jgi:hypothetical protein